MSSLPFPDRVVHTVSGTPGTSACTLGSAAPGCQSLSDSASGIASGEYVTYEISDTDSAWEIGEGLLTESAGVWTLTRTHVIESSAGLATAISATSAALVGVTLRGIDIADFNCGFTNKFRNPGMDIAQRGVSGSVTAGTAVYTLDGWYVNPTGVAAAWSQQWGANMKGNALRLSCASGLTDMQILTRIESYLAADLLTDALAAQAVTISFLIYNNSGASITPTISVSYATARDNFASVSTDLSTSGMQACPNGALTKVSYTFVPASPSGWSNGIEVVLSFGSGLNASTGYVDIGRADIRATPGRPVGLCYCPPRPEIRPVHQELTFCQRYYVIRNYTLEISSAYYDLDSYYQNTSYMIEWQYPTVMRAAPTLTIINGAWAGTTPTIGIKPDRAIFYNASTHFYLTVAAASIGDGRSVAASAEL